MDALRDLVREERARVAARVVAPVERGGRIRVDVAGMAWECRIAGDFAGWGVFEIGRAGAARLVREAEPWEREAYAPLRRLVLCAPGLAVDVRAQRLATVRLVEGAETFESIRAAWDGARHWFVDRGPGGDPRRALALRQALARGEEPERLSPAWRRIFEVARRLGHEDEAAMLRRRLEHALTVSGAELLDVTEVGAGVLDVAWRRRGRRENTRVTADDLTVLSAGFCLSGQDQEFDLAALVGVIRERDRA